MKSFLKTNLACVALVALVAVAGCSKKQPSDVLARVGEKEITVADFQAEIARRQANRLPLPERQVLLDQMVDRETFLQQARAAGLDKSDDVRREVENILITKLKETQLKPKMDAVKVSSEEIQAAYEKEILRYTQPAKAKLAIVFLAATMKGDTNQLAAVETRANEALAKSASLPKDANGFGQVAADFSDDQATRYRGGDAGWFAADEVETRWPKEVLSAGFALKNVGDVSGVLRGKEGFYLVKKLDVRASSVTPLENVRVAITQRLAVAKRLAAEKDFQTQARTAAKVTTDAAVLANVSYPTPTKNAPTALPVTSAP